MIRYINIAAIMAAMIQIPYSISVVAGLVFVISTLYYMLVFRIWVGITAVNIHTKFENIQLAINYLTSVVMLGICFRNGYELLAMYSLPWTVLQTMIVVWAVLLKYGYITISEK